MTKHVVPGDLQALLDQAVTNQKTLSFADRSTMFMQVMLQPPDAFLAPGLEKIGQVLMRTYSYMRSTKGRVEVSTSLLRQLGPLQAFADSKNLQLLGFYCDAETSGQALVDLPGLMALILLCRAGGVDAIIIEDADRLARSGFLLIIFDLLSQHNIVIFDLMLGRPLTHDLAMLKAYIATQGVKKLDARTGRGTSIKAQSSRSDDDE